MCFGIGAVYSTLILVMMLIPERPGNYHIRRMKRGDTIPNTHAITLLDHRGTMYLCMNPREVRHVFRVTRSEAVPPKETETLPDKDSLSTTKPMIG